MFTEGLTSTSPASTGPLSRDPSPVLPFTSRGGLPSPHPHSAVVSCSVSAGARPAENGPLWMSDNASLPPSTSVSLAGPVRLILQYILVCPLAPPPPPPAWSKPPSPLSTTAGLLASTPVPSVSQCYLSDHVTVDENPVRGSPQLHCGLPGPAWSSPGHPYRS